MPINFLTIPFFRASYVLRMGVLKSLSATTAARTSGSRLGHKPDVVAAADDR